MPPELLQGDGSYPSAPISVSSKAVPRPRGSTAVAGISVELEVQTAAKLAGRQSPEGLILPQKRGTGSLPQDWGCSLGTP